MSYDNGPGAFALAVTPDDATVLTATTRGLYIGSTGDVTVRMAKQGNTVTFVDVPVGILPVIVDKVMNTGTGATDIVALW